MEIIIHKFEQKVESYTCTFNIWIRILNKMKLQKFQKSILTIFPSLVRQLQMYQCLRQLNPFSWGNSKEVIGK